jgi:hypothetical protein
MDEQAGRVEGVYETDDLSLAGYLKMRKVRMIDYVKQKHRTVFMFEDEDGARCKKLHIEFLNSECKAFDSEVRDLKKIWK